MARRKNTRNQTRPLYVRNKRRKGDNSTMTRRALSVVLLLFVVCGVLFGIKEGFEWIGRKLYSENPRFEIQHLVISCDGRLTEDRIREYTGLAEGLNLFAVKFEAIEANLEKVPAIESVYLERKLPHTLIVKVKERIPVARINGRQSRRFPFVVDRYGIVLPPRQSASSLPLISGIDSDLRLGLRAEHPDVETVLKIIALCDSMGSLREYVRIESLDVQYNDFIVMRLEGGIRVRMPRFSLKTKLQNLATVIKIAHGQGRRVKEVDLTLDSAKVPVTYYKM
jgi:cell division septal protein FtsQ